METHLLLSVVNTKLRNGENLEDVARDLNLTKEELSDYLAKEGYVFDSIQAQFKK